MAVNKRISWPKTLVVGGTQKRSTRVAVIVVSGLIQPQTRVDRRKLYRIEKSFRLQAWSAKVRTSVPLKWSLES